MKTIRTTPRLARRLSRRALVLALILAAGVGWSFPATAATVYTAILDGPSESPPVPSPGIGMAIVTHYPAGHLLTIDVTFSGLVGTTTVAHIHAPTAMPFAGNVGVAVTPGTLPGFPAGVTSGSYMVTLDLADISTYTAGFLTLSGGTWEGAEALLLNAFDDGKAYLNIHSTEFRAGEIRGFLVPARTPEGGAPLFAFAATLGALCWIRRQTGTA